MTNLRIFSTFGDAETAWRRFEHIADHYVFQSFNWLSTWHELVGVHRNIRLCLVSVEDSRGAPLMFLPLGIERRWGIRRLVWLGATNADYRAPLLSRAKDQNLSPPEFRAIWDEVTDALPEFDVIHFEFQPELVLDQANPFIGLNVEPGYFDAHYARLPNDWDAFYAEKLGAKSRSTERRKERRLADHGELCLIDAGTREEIHDIVDEMILQKSGYYVQVGARNIFSKPGYRDFYLEMALRYSNPGTIRLSALKLDGTVIAAHWGASLGGRFYYLMPSYTDREIKRFAPGNILLKWLIQRSIDAGDRVFDFTIGDEAYKDRWCDGVLRLFNHLEAINLRGRIYVLAVRARSWIKRIIKGSAALFSAFKLVRAIGTKCWRR